MQASTTQTRRQLGGVRHSQHLEHVHHRPNLAGFVVQQAVCRPVEDGRRGVVHHDPTGRRGIRHLRIFCARNKNTTKHSASCQGWLVVIEISPKDASHASWACRGCEQRVAGRRGEESWKAWLPTFPFNVLHAFGRRRTPWRPLSCWRLQVLIDCTCRHRSAGVPQSESRQMGSPGRGKIGSEMPCAHIGRSANVVRTNARMDLLAFSLL